MQGEKIETKCQSCRAREERDLAASQKELAGMYPNGYPYGQIGSYDPSDGEKPVYVHDGRDTDLLLGKKRIHDYKWPMGTLTSIGMGFEIITHVVQRLPDGSKIHLPPQVLGLKLDHFREASDYQPCEPGQTPSVDEGTQTIPA